MTQTKTVATVEAELADMKKHLAHHGLAMPEAPARELTPEEKAPILEEIATHEAERRAEVDAIQAKQAEVQERWDAARAKLNAANEEMTHLRNELLRGNDLHHARRAELARKLEGGR